MLLRLLESPLPKQEVLPVYSGKVFVMATNLPVRLLRKKITIGVGLALMTTKILHPAQSVKGAINQVGIQQRAERFDRNEMVDICEQQSGSFRFVCTDVPRGVLIPGDVLSDSED